MRRKDREIKEISEVLNIVERAKVLRMGLFDGEYPYIIPLHYGYEYKDDVLIFYTHGAKEGHKIDLIYMNPKSLQYFMGHANITMTLNYYAHATYESARDEFAQG